MFDFNNLNFDLDGDGIPDCAAEGIDTDGDGVADLFSVDMDGDGQIDAGFADTDGDGEADTYIFQADYDGDNTFGEMGFLSASGTEGVTMEEIDGGGGHIAGTYADELECFDPGSADMDVVSGNPAESMGQWEYQGDTGRCALYSQKFVIEELTGENIDIEEFCDLAEANGWFDESSGTSIMDMNKMLDYYGVNNEVSFHNDISDIQDCLESGRKVIVSIDADEVWYGENDDLFVPGDGVNHAVEVIGIDYSNQEDPMVILNDSGNPNGCGEMVPLDTFVDAWEDGNCHMVTCM